MASWSRVVLMALLAGSIFLISGNSWAFEIIREEGIEKIKVEKGDTLWGISHSLWGSGLLFEKLQIANAIADPRKLQIGTILEKPKVGKIPLRNFNTSPYGAIAEKRSILVLEGIEKTHYSRAVKTALYDFVGENEPKPYLIESGLEVDYISDAKGVYYNEEGYVFKLGNGNLPAFIWEVKALNDFQCKLIIIQKCGNLNIVCTDFSLNKERVAAAPSAVPRFTIDPNGQFLRNLPSEVSTQKIYGHDPVGTYDVFWERNRAFALVCALAIFIALAAYFITRRVVRR